MSFSNIHPSFDLHPFPQSISPTFRAILFKGLLYMMRRLRDALRGLTQDDDNHNAQQPYQAGPPFGGNLPQSLPGAGIWPPHGPPTGYLPPPGAMGYGGPSPTYGMGVPQPSGPQYQHHPGLPGYASPPTHSQLAAIPPPLTAQVTGPGPAAGYWQSAMAPQPAQVPQPTLAPQRVMVSQPAMLPQPGVIPQQAMTRQQLPNIPIASTSGAPSSQADSSALTLRLAPQLKSPAVYCRWCEKCKQGRSWLMSADRHRGQS
jgi:hypothetical protein